MSKRYLQVKDREDLVRDTQSGAIINTDQDAYTLHQSKKRARDIKKMENFLQRKKLNKLENDIKDIKCVLGKILEKLDGINSGS